MSTVIKTSSTPIAASPEQVWKTIASDFLDISAWAGGVKSSTANPATLTGINGSPHGGRICDIEGMGLTDERIVAFDADTRTLTYSVSAKGLPFFVDTLHNSWTVRGDATDGAAAVVDMKIHAVTKGLVGPIGAIPLGMMLGKAAVGLPQDLKKYVETV